MSKINQADIENLRRAAADRERNEFNVEAFDRSISYLLVSTEKFDGFFVPPLNIRCTELETDWSLKCSDKDSEDNVLNEIFKNELNDVIKESYRNNCLNNSSWVNAYEAYRVRNHIFLDISRELCGKISYSEKVRKIYLENYNFIREFFKIEIKGKSIMDHLKSGLKLDDISSTQTGIYVFNTDGMNYGNFDSKTYYTSKNKFYISSNSNRQEEFNGSKVLENIYKVMLGLYNLEGETYDISTAHSESCKYNTDELSIVLLACKYVDTTISNVNYNIDLLFSDRQENFEEINKLAVCLGLYILTQKSLAINGRLLQFQEIYKIFKKDVKLDLPDVYFKLSTKSGVMDRTFATIAKDINHNPNLLSDIDIYKIGFDKMVELTTTFASSKLNAVDVYRKIIDNVTYPAIAKYKPNVNADDILGDLDYLLVDYYTETMDLKDLLEFISVGCFKGLNGVSKTNDKMVKLLEIIYRNAFQTYQTMDNGSNYITSLMTTILEMLESEQVLNLENIFKFMYCYDEKFMCKIILALVFISVESANSLAELREAKKIELYENYVKAQEEIKTKEKIMNNTTNNTEVMAVQETVAVESKPSKIAELDAIKTTIAEYDTDGFVKSVYGIENIEEDVVNEFNSKRNDKAMLEEELKCLIMRSEAVKESIDGEDKKEKFEIEFFAKNNFEEKLKSYKEAVDSYKEFCESILNKNNEETEVVVTEIEEDKKKEDSEKKEEKETKESSKSKADDKSLLDKIYDKVTSKEGLMVIGAAALGIGIYYYLNRKDENEGSEGEYLLNGEESFSNFNSWSAAQLNSVTNITNGATNNFSSKLGNSFTENLLGFNKSNFKL